MGPSMYLSLFWVASIVSVDSDCPTLVHQAMDSCKSWLTRRANSSWMVTVTPSGVLGVLNTLVEVEERKRGLEKLQSAYKALTEGFSYFDQCCEPIVMSFRRIDSLAAEVTTAESIAERLAVEEREKVSN